jgi:endonuclease YncB( thermonuclease family)
MDALSSSMMGAKSAWRQSRLLLWLRRRIAQTGAGPAAALALGALAGGDQVLLRRAENGSDRYGRLFAYAYTLRDGDEFLLQQEPVAEGFARVSTRIANPCAGHLLDRERAAREAKLGLWADPYYEVLNAETPKDALAQRGRFARSRAGRKST